jgi:hypothetical protein
VAIWTHLGSPQLRTRPSLSTPFYSVSTQCDAVQRARVPIGKPSHRAPPQWREPAATDGQGLAELLRLAKCGSQQVRRGQPSAPSAVRSQRMLDPGSFPCSSRLPSKLSPPIPGPRKSPTAAGIRATGLGFGERNVPANCSPNADLSPELEGRPFYSTSFFASGFSGLASLANRKVGIPFARRIPRWLLPTAVDTAPTLHNQHYRPS